MKNNFNKIAVVVGVAGLLLGFFLGLIETSPWVRVFLGGLYSLISMILVSSRVALSNPRRVPLPPHKILDQDESDEAEAMEYPADPFDSKFEPVDVEKSGLQFPLSLRPVGSIEVPKTKSKKPHAMGRFEGQTPWFQFIPMDRSAKPHADLKELFEMITKLDEVKGRRLVITQFQTETRLVDPLEQVLKEGRPISSAILKGIYRETDLIPLGRLVHSSGIDHLLEFLSRHYSQVILFAPSSERAEWIARYRNTQFETQWTSLGDNNPLEVSRTN